MKKPPGKLLLALVAHLTALKFPDKYDGAAHPFAGQLCFQAVKSFDFDDLPLAFEELFVFKDRAAFVVLTHEDQTSRVEGQTMVTSFRDTFAVLCSDRSYKNRQLALTGDSTTPGVLMLSDALITGSVGEFSAGMVCEPMGGELFAMTGEVRDEQIGRIGWRQNFRLHGGRELRSLSRTALLTYAPMGA